MSGPRLTLLLVEDDPVDCEAVYRLLPDRYTIREAMTVQEVRAILQAEPPDCVLLDYHMPGIDTLALLSECSALPVPVVMLTGVGSEAVAVEAMKRGAQDYLLKSALTPVALKRAIANAIEKVALQRELHGKEIELRESEHRYRTLVERSIQGIYIHQDRIIQFANPAFATTFGYDTPQKLVGRPYWMTVAPHERGRLESYRTARLQGHAAPVQYQYQGIRQDGTLIWLECLVSLIQWSGKPALSVTLVDISKHKQAEAELRQQRDWFDVTLSSIGDAVIATDTRGIITFINPVAEGLTGWTAREVLGHPVDEVFHILHEQTRQPVESPIAHVLRRGTIVGVTTQAALLTRDGREIAITNSGAPIRSHNGKLHGAVLVFRDMTEARQMEAELLRAQKIESVGVLAGGIAHDFNNLLTAIMGNLSLAKRFAGLDSRVVARLTEAENACQRATALTHQLLTFSKGGTPVRQTVSIAELLSESVGFALHGSKVRGDLAIAEDLWPVDVDENQIHQVIHNVLLNAVQAMPDGGNVGVWAENVRLEAGCRLPVPAGRYIKIVVRDQGCGIDAETLPNIFDPYFTTKAEGSGLGLATAYAIVAKHDGYITVESEVGQGTTVYLYLPASQYEVVPKPSLPDALGVGSGRILVMDDEAIIRNLLCEMLESFGYEVDCAQNGQEVIALYQRARAAGRSFDAVILDITVPGGWGGRETIASLQAIDPHVKAIISSGYANDPVMANYTQYGFRGVVTKPYTAQRLYTALQHVMEDRSGV